MVCAFAFEGIERSVKVELQITRDSRTRSVGEQSPPQELVAWALEHFADRHTVITTSFGMEGCALIDMCAREGKPLKVVYLDTMLFFRETYELIDRMVERYPHVEFINRGTNLTVEEQETCYGPMLWKNDPDQCCKLRKVTPMRETLAGVDVWITGLRRGQSSKRASLRAIEWDWKFRLIKISPLAYWDRGQVWQYVRDNKVPYNELHEKSYPTIGCTYCTSPVPGSKIGEYDRSGRWVGKDKTECGLHGDGI